MTMTTCVGSCSPTEAEAISVYQAIGGRAAPRHLADRIVGIAAGLESAVVTA